MKYLGTSELDTVGRALTFSTPDVHLVGGCDLYTTKAAGNDKKLYRAIDDYLESQFESLRQLSESLSPPAMPATAVDDVNNKPKARTEANAKPNRGIRARTVDAPNIDLSRASPFGSLKDNKARKTFAYLIAILNATNPDYDFTQVLNPSDFQRERNLRELMARVDSILYRLRPRSVPSSAWLAPANVSASAPAAYAPNGNVLWNSTMWNLIDKEMDLKRCEKYSYRPDINPFEGEDSALYSYHYFFFNKARKRVCYFYLRAFSVISHSPVNVPYHSSLKEMRDASSIMNFYGASAGRRAAHWSGDADSSDYGDDYDNSGAYYDPDDDDEVDVPEYQDMDKFRDSLGEGNYGHDYGTYTDDVDMDVDGMDWEGRGQVRGVSEEVEAAIEV